MSDMTETLQTDIYAVLSVMNELQTRRYTSETLEKATQITGKKYKPNQGATALKDIRQLLETMKDE